MAADYHSEKPHVLDYTKYPGTKYIWSYWFLILIFILDTLMGSIFVHSSLLLCSYRNRYPWAEAICADVLELIR
jgi:hypothetical protein